MRERAEALFSSTMTPRTSGLPPQPFITLAALHCARAEVARRAAGQRANLVLQKAIASLVADYTGVAQPWDLESCGQKIDNALRTSAPSLARPIAARATPRRPAARAPRQRSSQFPSGQLS